LKVNDETVEMDDDSVRNEVVVEVVGSDE